ncbi:class A beta-lactamase-related serine hydrolase [Luteimonas sp. BDR2-5]|uniref:serine hydrolase n=1 Tax=Proluteimonas luteida TaxID=2878685 RepID=UPI001E425D9F|nr:serine hydrolase [Luteimonas sp. BDR2-5]MCD9027390.1 class A beta-lactamase-related serine hydrolase [Luteimonas sp. BDR2-5]
MISTAPIPRHRRSTPVAALSLCLLALLAGCRGSEPPGPDDPAQAQAVEAAAAIDAPWIAALDADVSRIDDAMPGDFGVYVRHYGASPGTLDRGGDRAWYLSSTIKVPVAIAVLEQVDTGRIGLDEELVLARTDFVDGAGDMLQHKPGERFSIATLLEKSLRDSDSTATDMLIRKVGEAHLNRRIRDWAGDGFGPVTTILQVRYDAYGPVHPGVADLDNMAILRLRNAEAGEPRLQALADTLGVARDALDAGSLDAVFEAYYRRGDNAATLPAFARLLDRLAAGELLSPESTRIVLGHMRGISTGDRRIAAGLSTGTDFAQKTGTQLGRACNVGIIDPDSGRHGATIVLACAERFDDIAQAEQAFQSLGRALDETLLASRDR